MGLYFDWHNKSQSLGISDCPEDMRWVYINNEEEAKKVIEMLEYYFNLGDDAGVHGVG